MFPEATCDPSRLTGCLIISRVPIRGSEHVPCNLYSPLLELLFAVNRAEHRLPRYVNKIICLRLLDSYLLVSGEVAPCRAGQGRLWLVLLHLERKRISDSRKSVCVLILF